ncbi:MAG: GNAT family N-acetyltransferase [Syntrophobacteraceae bacterium]
MVEGVEWPVELRSCRLAPVTSETAGALSISLSQMDPWRTLGYLADGLRRYLLREDPGLARTAVFKAGELAGVVCVRSPWLRGASLELLAVLPECRGEGVGAEIMGWIEDRALPVGPNLWTTVSSFNVEAQRFYERCGFEPVACLTDLIKSGFDELLLRKRLKTCSGVRTRETGRGLNE